MSQDKPDDKQGGLRANAPKNIYKNDFTQEDWKKWAEELENQPPPRPPKMEFYSKEAFDNWNQMVEEYFKKNKKP